MSKVHVLVPHTIDAACGVKNPTKVGLFKEQITCPLCKDTVWFKELRKLPKRKGNTC